MTKIVDGKVVLDDPQKWPDGLGWEAVISWIESGKGRFHRCELAEIIAPVLPWSTCLQLMGLDRDHRFGTYTAPAAEVAALLPVPFPATGNLSIDEREFIAIVAREYLNMRKDEPIGTCSTETEPVVCYGPWVARMIEKLKGYVK